jgi:hypothetical protein
MAVTATPPANIKTRRQAALLENRESLIAVDFTRTTPSCEQN